MDTNITIDRNTADMICVSVLKEAYACILRDLTKEVIGETANARQVSEDLMFKFAFEIVLNYFMADSEYEAFIETAGRS